MQPNVKIRRFLLVILFFLIISIPLLVYLISRPTKTQTFVNKVGKKVLATSGYEKLPINIEDKLSTINNMKKTKDERYKALYGLSFIFANAYSTTHDPSIRKFSSEVIDSYFKSEFPEKYNDSLFNFPCSDPECGEKLSPEIESVIKVIKESEIPEYKKDSIIINLTVTGYAPESDLAGKKFGMELVIDQLRKTGNPEASKAAETLIKEYKDKYTLDL